MCVQSQQLLDGQLSFIRTDKTEIFPIKISKAVDINVGI